MLVRKPVFVSTNSLESRVVTIQTEFDIPSDDTDKINDVIVLELARTYALKTGKSAEVLEVSRYSSTTLGTELSSLIVDIESLNRMVEGIPNNEARFLPVKTAYNMGIDIFPLGAKNYTWDETANTISVFSSCKQDALGRTANSVSSWDLAAILYLFLYCQALNQEHNKHLKNEVLAYQAFTDVTFSRYTSITTPAEGCALFVSLHRLGDLEEALASVESFVKIISTTDLPCFDEDLICEDIEFQEYIAQYKYT